MSSPFSIPLSRIDSAPRYWPVAGTLSAILVVAICIGTLAQFFGPAPIPWVQDHSQSPSAKARAAGIAIVSLEQARDLVSGGDFLILDARSARDFEAGRLPGAISFPNATRAESYY